MVRFSVLLMVLALAACSTQQDKESFYSYVDADGNLHHTDTKTSEQSSDEKEQTLEPISNEENITAAAPEKAFGKFGQPSNDNQSAQEGIAIVGESSQVSHYEDAAEVAAEDDERFVVFPGADGQLVRKQYDQQEIKKIQEAEKKAAKEYQDYQWIPDDFVESELLIDANCCKALIDDAASTTVKAVEKVMFSTKQNQQISLSAQESWPVRVYEIPESAQAMLLRSYQTRHKYLHPQLLFLNKAGEPVLQVNSPFNKRFAESWNRHSYLEGSLLIEDDYAYVAIYVGYAEDYDPQQLPFVIEKNNQLTPNGKISIEFR